MEIDAIARRYNVGIIVWELSKAEQLVTPINKPQPTVSKYPQNLYLVRHRGVCYGSVFQKDGNHCLTQNRSLLKRNNKKKASDSHALESAIITVFPMELDRDNTSDGEATDTCGGFDEGDLAVLQYPHQTRISGLSKPLSRNVNDPELCISNTVNDTKDCCMIECDATEKTFQSTVIPAGKPCCKKPYDRTSLDLLRCPPEISGYADCAASTECSRDTKTNGISSSAKKANEICLDSCNVLCPLPDEKLGWKGA